MRDKDLPRRGLRTSVHPAPDLIKDFPRSIELLQEALAGQTEALAALGTYEPPEDAGRTPGQLSVERERRNRRVMLVRERFYLPGDLTLPRLIKESTRALVTGQELVTLIIWALAIVQGRIESAVTRIEGEQILAELGRRSPNIRTGFKASIDDLARGFDKIDSSASEFHARRPDGILPHMPSGFFRDDLRKAALLTEMAADTPFYPWLYGTRSDIGSNSQVRFDSAFRAGVGDFAAIVAGLIGTAESNARIAHLASCGLWETVITTHPKVVWKGSIHNDDIRRWRDSTAENRAREA